MTDESSSGSALTKPFRTVFGFIGSFIDAIVYFFDSLISPSRGRYNRGRLTNSDRGYGGRVHTLPGSNGPRAPNMAPLGCQSCR